MSIKLYVIMIFIVTCCPSLCADMTMKTKVDISIFNSQEITILVKEYIVNNSYSYQIKEIEVDINEPFLPSEGVIVSFNDKSICMLDYDNGTYDQIPLKSFGEMRNSINAEWPPEAIDQFDWSVSVENNLNDSINSYNCSGIRVKVDGINKVDTLQKIVIICEQWKTDDIAIPNNIDSPKQLLAELSGTELNPILIIMEEMSNLYYPDFEFLSEQFQNLQGFLIRSTLSIGMISPPDKRNDNQDKVITVYDEAVEMMRYIKQQSGQNTKNEIMFIFSLNSNLIDIGFDKIDKSVITIPKDFEKIVE